MARHALLLVAALSLSIPAFGQSRVEVSGGVTWTNGFEAGGSNALLSRGTPGTPLTLFATSPRVDAAPGLVARASFGVTDAFAVEALAEASRPTLRVGISNDFEQAAGAEVTTRTSSYLFGGSLVYRFGRGRVTPFALGGAAHLRQLDEENVVLVTGVELHAGGGLRYGLSPHWAIRGDAMMSWREKSLAFDRKRRALPMLSAGASYRF